MLAHVFRIAMSFQVSHVMHVNFWNTFFSFQVYDMITEWFYEIHIKFKKWFYQYMYMFSNHLSSVVPSVLASRFAQIALGHRSPP